MAAETHHVSRFFVPRSLNEAGDVFFTWRPEGRSSAVMTRRFRACCCARGGGPLMVFFKRRFITNNTFTSLRYGRRLLILHVVC